VKLILINILSFIYNIRKFCAQADIFAFYTQYNKKKVISITT